MADPTILLQWVLDSGNRSVSVTEKEEKEQSRAKHSLPPGNSYLKEKRREWAKHTLFLLSTSPVR